MPRFLLTLAVILVAFALDTDASTRPNLAASSAQVQPDIDGLLTEAIWDHTARASHFIQAEPRPGLPADKQTEVWIVFTESHLLIGARMYDDEPEHIVGTEYQRDAILDAEDNFEVYHRKGDHLRLAVLMTLLHRHALTLRSRLRPPGFGEVPTKPWRSRTRAACYRPIRAGLAADDLAAARQAAWRVRVKEIGYWRNVPAKNRPFFWTCVFSAKAARPQAPQTHRAGIPRPAER